MAKYSFVSEWKIPAPMESVWDAITRPEDWPRWWRGVEAVVELEPGDALGLGRLLRYTWKSELPYKLEFNMRTTRIEQYSVYAGTAEGELQGSGVWKFSQQGEITVAEYDWNVETTEEWMNIVAPIARPVFEWNHDVIMKWGEEGLRRLLGVDT